MNIPNWYALLLLGAAAFGTWHAIAEADISDRFRRYITRLGPDWQKEGDPIPAGYRIGLMKFILCPWCFGFYCTLGWYASWQIWSHTTLILAALEALALFPPALERLLSSS